MDTPTTIFIVVLTVFTEQLLEQFGKGMNQFFAAWRDKYREIEQEYETPPSPPPTPPEGGDR